MMTPSERLISVGVPQPSLAIGPIRNVPCCGGKIARRSLMMRGALATMSCGNMMLSIAPVRTPSISGSSSIVRLRPSRPPTAEQREPKPSWIPAPNSAVMMISSEKPVRAVGHSCGDQADRREREEVGELELQRAGVLAALGVDREKPPPLTTPASTARPTPFGGLNATPRSTGPALPPPDGKRHRGDHAEAVDARGERPELAPRSPRRARAGACRCRSRRRGRSSWIVDRPERHVHGDLDLERPLPVEAQPGVRRERDSEAEVGLDVDAGEQRRDEAVALRRVDDELAAGHRRLRPWAAMDAARRAVERDVGAGGERDARDLQTRAAGLAEEQQRRGRGCAEREVDTRAGAPAGLAERDVQWRLHGPGRPGGDRPGGGDRRVPVWRGDGEGERPRVVGRLDDRQRQTRRTAGEGREVDAERFERDRSRTGGRVERDGETEMRERAVERRQQLGRVEAGLPQP